MRFGQQMAFRLDFHVFFIAMMNIERNNEINILRKPQNSLQLIISIFKCNLTIYITRAAYLDSIFTLMFVNTIQTDSILTIFS